MGGNENNLAEKFAIVKNAWHQGQHHGGPPISVSGIHISGLRLDLHPVWVFSYLSCSSTYCGSRTGEDEGRIRRYVICLQGDSYFAGYPHCLTLLRPNPATTMLQLLTLPLLLAAGHGESSFLRKGDVILTIGDSITAQGVYQEFMQTVLDTLYPGQNIRVVNAGSGGMKADGGLNVLRSHLKKSGATIVTVMFGVNDTMWSASQAEAKAKTFSGHIGAIFDEAEKQEVPVLLLRESHFSHSKKSDPWVDQINKTLETILAAGDRLAAERKIPVIDVLGAYKAALELAWVEDPRYEFTPDVIHPTQPGHSAIAAEILRALGAGLPLSSKERGPVRPKSEPQVKLTAATGFGNVLHGQKLPLVAHVTSRTKQKLEGEGLLVAGAAIQTSKLQMDKGETQNVTLQFKPRAAARWGCFPLYMAFKTKTAFHAGHALFYFSKVHDVSKGPLQISARDFRPVSGKSECPVTDVSLSMDDSVQVTFRWKDETVVPAQPGFKTRFGKQVNAALDLESRSGQPCDAVEVFIDTRPGESTGRPTAGADANPEGVIRLGVHRTKEKNAKLTLPQGTEGATAQVAQIQPNLYRLTFRPKSNGSAIGISMRVTDTDAFGIGKGRVYDLTGRAHVSLEPMSFIRMSKTGGGVFFRVGY